VVARDTLPVIPEIRIAIYGLALQDIVDSITSNIASPSYIPGHPRPIFRCRGAIALLYTSKTLRAESRHELLPLVVAHTKNSDALARLHRTQFNDETDDYEDWCLEDEAAEGRVGAMCVSELAFWRCGPKPLGSLC
jgi:hypothetical protein